MLYIREKDASDKTRTKEITRKQAWKEGPAYVRGPVETSAFRLGSCLQAGEKDSAQARGDLRASGARVEVARRREDGGTRDGGLSSRTGHTLASRGGSRWAFAYSRGGRGAAATTAGNRGCDVSRKPGGYCEARLEICLSARRRGQPGTPALLPCIPDPLSPGSSFPSEMALVGRLRED